MIDIFGIVSVDAAYVVAALAGTILFAVITFVLAIIGIVKASNLKKKYKTFMEGSDGVSIEKLIKSNLKDVKEIKSTTVKNSQNISDIYNKLEKTFCKVGINKYDAFHEMGGKLSFALCMLDMDNNGYIVNVMHSNNGCFAYIKEIVNGESYIELGGEEKKSLDDALSSTISIAAKSNEAAKDVAKEKKTEVKSEEQNSEQQEQVKSQEAPQE